MKLTRTVMVVAAAVVALGVVGAGAWWLGMQQGMAQSSATIGANMQTEGGPAAGAIDPDQWTIAQGEDATRRHIQSGLKVGDIDPVLNMMRVSTPVKRKRMTACADATPKLYFWNA